MGRNRRTGLVWGVIALVVVIAVVVAARLIWTSARSALSYDHCTVGSYDLDPGQAAVASTMVGVVSTRGLPERADVLVLAAALQESKLRNLAPGAGDRDSVGVLQQRPSQGWGTEAQLTDLHYATGAFLNALVKLPGWQGLDLADAIQQVQISADGSAYTQHADEAQTLADALTGTRPAGITCSFDKPSVVAAAATVAAKVRADLPVEPPTTSGLSVSVPGASWQTAAWFVSYADQLGVEKVGYGGKEWTRAKGWRAASTSSAAVVATLYGG